MTDSNRGTENGSGWVSEATNRVGDNIDQAPLIALLDKIEALVNRRQHSQRQAIDFQDAERVEIVFVPLDDGPSRHRGVLDGA